MNAKINFTNTFCKLINIQYAIFLLMYALVMTPMTARAATAETIKTPINTGINIKIKNENEDISLSCIALEKQTKIFTAPTEVKSYISAINSGITLLDGANKKENFMTAAIQSLESLLQAFEKAMQAFERAVQALDGILQTLDSLSVGTKFFLGLCYFIYSRRNKSASVE